MNSLRYIASVVQHRDIDDVRSPRILSASESNNAAGLWVPPGLLRAGRHLRQHLLERSLIWSHERLSGRDGCE